MEFGLKKKDFDNIREFKTNHSFFTQFKKSLLKSISMVQHMKSLGHLSCHSTEIVSDCGLILNEHNMKFGKRKIVTKKSNKKQKQLSCQFFSWQLLW